MLSCQSHLNSTANINKITKGVMCSNLDIVSWFKTLPNLM